MSKVDWVKYIHSEPEIEKEIKQVAEREAWQKTVSKEAAFRRFWYGFGAARNIRFSARQANDGRDTNGLMQAAETVFNEFFEAKK